MHKNIFSFYIQKRLTSNNPILTYEQNQLETFSLRNDRYCSYSINVQYWYQGSQVFKSTGLKKHRFGKAKSKMTEPFEVELPSADLDDDEIPVQGLYILYSFTFPVD